VATLLFCDLCDSTRFAAELEAETYGEILERVQGVLEAVVPRHGGRIGQIYGDGALALFAEGPDGPDSAVDSALAAALDLHARVRALASVEGQALRLHSGVHAGLVLMRPGDAARGRFEALGLATSVAARLAAAAQPDEILVSDATLGPARWRYRLGSPRTVPIDRAGDHVLAVPVSGRADAATRLAAAAGSPRGLSPFVGRTAELAAADAMLQSALREQASALLFTAPPGQGKSRFAAEVARRAAGLGFAVLAGASEPGGEPLEPFRQMVRSLTGPGGAPPGLTAEVLNRALGAAAMAPLVTSAAAEPAALAAEVRAQIERLAALAPVLLLLDDWQWADAASVQLLKSLTAARGRVAMLLLARPADAGTLPLEAVAEAALPPLDEAEGLDMILARLPALDSVVARRLHLAAGGNPLYIEELCHLAAENGLAMPDLSGAGWFAASIEARYRRLPAPLATLVRTAAVIGMTVPEALLAEIAGLTIDAAARAELARLDLLFPAERHGQLRFKHGLARDILYQLVAGPERRTLHARIAAAIAAQEPDAHEALARHFSQSGQHAEAADHAEKAGHAAAQAAAIDRAQLYYRLALDSLDRLPQTPETIMRWASIVRRFAMIAIYDADESHLALFEEASRRARLFGDRIAMATTSYWIGYMLSSTGSAPAAIRHFDEALELANANGAARLAAEIRATKGHALSAMSAYAEALPLLEEGTTLQHKPGRPSMNAPPSLAFKAAVLADQGDFDPAYDCLEGALAMIAGSGHQVEGTIQSWYAQVLLWQGRPAEALIHARRDRDVTELTESAYMNALARHFLAAASHQLTPGPAHRHTMAATTRCLLHRRKQLYISMCHARCAEAAAEAGDMAATRAAAALALGRARAGDLLGAAMAWRALARIAGTPARARHCLERARRIADRRNSPHERAVTFLAEAELALQHENPHAARAPLDKAQALFDRLAMPWFSTRAEQIRSAL
jgi:class 3 adenylate cyclase/tetratricopeptide (TPR) repeat protein